MVQVGREDDGRWRSSFVGVDDTVDLEESLRRGSQLVRYLTEPYATTNVSIEVWLEGYGFAHHLACGQRPLWFRLFFLP